MNGASGDEFADKVVLITGAAGGFGTLLTQSLIERGAKLVISDRNDDAIAALEQRHSGRRDQVAIRRCDVAREEEVQALVEHATAHFGRLDIAVNNAGLSTPMKAFTEVTEKELDINFAVNAKGVFFGMKHQLRQLMAQGGGGTILNVASKAGVGGAPKLAAYAAAKHAVVGLTRTAALEYAKHNIRVNAICPYYSPTPMVVDGIDVDTQQMLASLSPMRRLGQPQEMVAVMLMLIAPTTGYLSGQAIVVDGGMSAG